MRLEFAASAACEACWEEATKRQAGGDPRSVSEIYAEVLEEAETTIGAAWCPSSKPEEPEMRTTTETRNLPVKLSEDELAGKAQELAESVSEEEQQREAFAAWKSTMDEAAKAKKAGIYLAHAETVRLGEIVETGVENRDTPCTWLYTKEAAYLRRDDNGELVQVRDLRADEKQAVIGEEAVVQEPTYEDFIAWAGAETDSPDDPEGDGGIILLPGGMRIPVESRDEAMRELEKVVRETMR